MKRIFFIVICLLNFVSVFPQDTININIDVESYLEYAEKNKKIEKNQHYSNDSFVTVCAKRVEMPYFISIPLFDIDVDKMVDFSCDDLLADYIIFENQPERQVILNFNESKYLSWYSSRPDSNLEFMVLSDSKSPFPYLIKNYDSNYFYFYLNHLQGLWAIYEGKMYKVVVKKKKLLYVDADEYFRNHYTLGLTHNKFLTVTYCPNIWKRIYLKLEKHKTIADDCNDVFPEKNYYIKAPKINTQKLDVENYK